MIRLFNQLTVALAVIVATVAFGAHLGGRGSFEPATVAESAAFCPIPIKVEGSTTVFPITRAAEAPFESLFGPGTDAQLASIGSGAGINALTAGLVQVAPSSRPLNAGEASNKYVYRVALDAHVIAVKNDPAMSFLITNGIQVTHLQQIYSAGAGIATLKWSDLTPAIPGAPASPIIPRARITASGSQPDFLNSIGVSLAAEEATITATGLPRLVESVDMAEAAAANINVIVYTSLANLDVAGLAPVPVFHSGSATYVLPSPATVSGGTYPLPRQLFLAVRTKSIDQRIDNSNFVRADDFVNFVRSSAMTSVIQSLGFVPVAPGVKPPFPDWDIDLNGNTDLLDLGQVASKWGASSTCKGWIRADANNSGSVSLGDIGAVTNKWAGAGFACAVHSNPCAE